MRYHKRHALALLFYLCIGIVAAYNLSDVLVKVRPKSKLALPPTANISGTTTVCLNETPQPVITFTGADGDTPYTFTYTLNGGANQTITTTGTNNSVTLPVNTGAVGTFTYELVSVTDSNNDTETINETATVTVANPPTVSFTFNNGGCSADAVNFDATASGNGPFTYSWSFGDGETSTDEDPSHIYDAFGCGFSNYKATLEVTDANGCTTSVSETVNVEQRPDLSFEDLDAQFTPPFDNCGNYTIDPAYTINVGNTSASA